MSNKKSTIHLRDVIRTPGVPYITEAGEKRIDGMCKAEMLDYKIRIAMVEVKQMFCDHKHQTRMFLEGSNERITCKDCDKVWYD